jgi:hypothetical protein
MRSWFPSKYSASMRMVLASSGFVLEFASLPRAATSFSILPWSSQSSFAIHQRFCAAHRRDTTGGPIPRRVLIRDVPDPVRSVAPDHADAGAVPSPIPSLGINTEAKIFRTLDRAHIGGGTILAHGPVLIHIGLGKHSAQFALSGTSWLTWDSTGPAFGLRLHHQRLRPLHLYVSAGRR